MSRDPAIILRSLGYTAVQKRDAAIDIVVTNETARLAGRNAPFNDDETAEAVEYLEEHGGYGEGR